MARLLRLPEGRLLELGTKPVIMGIVNVTPDSFFGESRRTLPDEAAVRAMELIGEGADIIDFGAESTRPGSKPVPADEEMERLLPALAAFRRLSSAPVSVDTRHSETARAALSRGADIINDISSMADPGMAGAVAAAGAAVVLMHMQGRPESMQERPEYADCAVEVAGYLERAARAAVDAGISPDSVILDPGIGFGKTLEHNLDILQRLYLIRRIGYPVLVGLSRKRFVGELTGEPVDGRLAGSIGAACAAMAQGAAIFRVHDVRATKDALAVFTAAFRAPM